MKTRITRTRKTKLYVWRLENYHCGLAVAVAYNIPEAKLMIRSKAKRQRDYIAPWRLRRAPEMFPVGKPLAFYVEPAYL
jgi:hypothetical protein